MSPLPDANLTNLGSRAAFVQPPKASLRWNFEMRLGVHLLMQDEELQMSQKTSIFNQLFQADLARGNVGSISKKAFNNQHRQSCQEDTKKGETALAKDWQRVLKKGQSVQDRATEERLKKEIGKLRDLQEADEESGVDDNEEGDEESEGEGEDEVEEQDEQEFEDDVEDDVEDENDDMQDVDEAGEDMDIAEENAMEEIDELTQDVGVPHYDTAENVGRWSFRIQHPRHQCPELAARP